MRQLRYIPIFLCVVGVSAAQQSQTLSFRNGVAGYSSTRDVSITSQGGGNGLVSRVSTTNLCYELTGSYKARTLIRFDALPALAPGTAVVSATLELTAYSSVSGYVLDGYYLAVPWDPAASGLGWLRRTGTDLWNGPGASGAADRIPGRVTSWAAPKGGTQKVQLALAPEVVGAWLANPLANQGLVLVNQVPDKVVRLTSSRDPDLSKRPQLTIVVGAAAGDTLPPTVSVTSPSPGALVTAPVAAVAAATDNVGVASVRFLLDDAPFGSLLTASPFTVPIDPAALPDGPHNLKAEARDAAGNTATSSPVAFTSLSPATSSPVFGTPISRGTLAVAIHPTSQVVAGTPALVTFGMPFPRRSVLVSDLNKVRVLRNGQEVPASVKLLTPWRHVANPLLDGVFARVARIQFYHTFASAQPAEIQVEWGITPRGQNAVERNPRDGWHRVADADFPASDDVWEPNVYAVLPVNYLSAAGLYSALLQPFAASVKEQRSDPASTLAVTNWPEFTQYQTAAKDFFYTTVNRDDPRVTTANRCPFKTSSDPWLYDRGAAMFKLYLQSGFLTPLREAVRNTQLYMNMLYTDQVVPSRATGIFKLKVPDPAGSIGANGAMYSYNECLAYLYWLTGDDRPLPYISWVANAHKTQDGTTRWSASLGSWTERHTAYRLLSAVVEYEVTGSDAFRQDVTRIAGDFIWHQNGAGGALAANRVDGGLYHKGSQHGEGTASAFVASPWMSVLTVEAMARAYAVSEDAGIGDFIRRMGTFLTTVSRPDTAHGYGTSSALRYPDYLSRIDGTADMRSGSDAEHAIDVAGAMAWSYCFSKLLNKPDPALKNAAMDLYSTHSWGIRYWTRPTSPSYGMAAFRLSPWRKYNWQYTGSAALPYLLKGN